MENVGQYQQRARSAGKNLVATCCFLMRRHPSPTPSSLGTQTHALQIFMCVCRTVCTHTHIHTRVHSGAKHIFDMRKYVGNGNPGKKKQLTLVGSSARINRFFLFIYTQPRTNRITISNILICSYNLVNIFHQRRQTSVIGRYNDYTKFIFNFY